MPDSVNTVTVPKEELVKLEECRKSLYEFFEDKLNDYEKNQLTTLTSQMWRVANTKKWD